MNRPHAFLAAAALGGIVLACSPTNSGTATPMPPSVCRAAETVEVPEKLAYLRLFISSVAADYKAPRDSSGLAVQAASKVKLVTKANTCQNGVNALNALLQTPGVTRQVWLFDLGSGYAIVDPSLPPVSGQPEPLFLFNTQWKYKSTLRLW